jgi:hypothetical protein
MHCGHLYGLTPERYHSDLPHYGELARIFWKWFSGKMAELGPFDICVHNGDAVEGEGKKESREHLTTDTGRQNKIAIECLETTRAKKFYMTYGTPYHCTGTEDYERNIAEYLQAPIKNKLKLKIGGYVFDFKHHTGKSSIPHGGGTLLEKRTVWEHLKHTTEGHSLPDITVRSHIHEHRTIDDRLGLSMTTPALKLGDTVLGRKYDGWYDVGFYVFEVGDDSYDYQKYLYEIKVEEDLLHAEDAQNESEVAVARDGGEAAVAKV